MRSPSQITHYTERVYAGVLGKIIGVYLGRPFEGWSYEKIMAELGEVWYYVHEKRGVPLVVTDDDISGTFTFLRALQDYDYSPDLTPEQIGQTWLNYLIEKRTVLWWGGMGNSTEHTAYLRLKHGIKAPQSGSIETNGKVVAEQIGAQIFIDGWGMICPGDPERAVDFARRAGSVSHDGEAIYGAQVVAALEAQAFVEHDINSLLDRAVSFIPTDSVIYRMIGDIREWHSAEKDWRKTREKIAANYGYDKYGGNCHMVPNHGLIVHALLHGDGDFQKSLMIVNTCGWDTDCNSANVGCILGIRNGLEGFNNGPDWNGPIADRLYLSTADGGRCVTDAVRETYEIVNTARALVGESPLAPKDGARFHFSLPESVQGFQVEDSPECRNVASLRYALTEVSDESGVLCIDFSTLTSGMAMRVATATFTPPDALKMGGYSLFASPTLNPGQTVRAKIECAEIEQYMNADAVRSIPVRLYVRYYDAQDKLSRCYGPETLFAEDDVHTLEWCIPDLNGHPIAEIGIEATSERFVQGKFHLHWLTWEGTPDITLKRTEGTVWRRAWVDGVDHFEGWGEAFRVIQDEGIGLLMYGCRECTDYQVSATVKPHMLASGGIAARVQGMRRYYALLLIPGGKAKLVKALDGYTTLAEIEFSWQYGEDVALSLSVQGNRIQGTINNQLLFDVIDSHHPLTGGGIAYIVEEGRMASESVHVQPL